MIKNIEKELDKIFDKWEEVGINPKAYKLYTVLRDATKLKQYQQGYLYHIGEPGKKQTETYCNVYARDVLDSEYQAHLNSWANGIGGLVSEYSYDLTPIHPDYKPASIILNTTIPVAYKNIKEAHKKDNVKLLTPHKAQIMANEGIPIHVISVWCNHEAIVCPNPNGYDKDNGPLLGQAGAYNGIVFLKDKKTFGAYNDLSDILYVQYNELRK